MLKKIALAAAVLVAMFGLTAVPASVAQAAPINCPGIGMTTNNLCLYGAPAFDATAGTQTPTADLITTNCQDVTLADGAMSAFSTATTPATTVALYRAPNPLVGEEKCDASTLLATLAPNTSVAAFALPVKHFQQVQQVNP